MTGTLQEITAAEAKRLHNSPGTLFLDVREPWEFALCHIAGSVHIPMGDIPARFGEIASDAIVVVLCHHGMRSRQVMHFLSQSGFDDVRNLAGGIDAWAREIDPQLATY